MTVVWYLWLFTTWRWCRLQQSECCVVLSTSFSIMEIVWQSLSSRNNHYDASNVVNPLHANVWTSVFLIGAFLLPYFVCLITGGIPIFFLEVGLGQFMSEGGITAWNICPVFRGILYSCILSNNYLHLLVNYIKTVQYCWRMFHKLIIHIFYYSVSLK